MDQFNVGDRVKLKRHVTWLFIPPGTKGTVVRIDQDGKVLYIRTEGGDSYWVKPEELELDESKRRG